MDDAVDILHPRKIHVFKSGYGIAATTAHVGALLPLPCRSMPQ